MLLNLGSQASWDVAARKRGDVRLLLASRLRRRTLTARLLRRHFGAFPPRFREADGNGLLAARHFSPGA